MSLTFYPSNSPITIPSAGPTTEGLVTLNEAGQGATILPSRADFPPATSGNAGQMFIDSSSGILYYSNGTTYVGVSDATESFTIYVDPVTGSDANPGTQLLPLQTFLAAVKALPTNWRQHATIQCAPGNYTIDVPDFPSPTVLGTLWGHPDFDPDQAPWLYINGAFNNLLGDLTVTVGSTGTTLTAAVATVADAYFGNFILATTGANAGVYGMIADNDNAGTFTLNAPFPNAIAPGDQFQVLSPSVVFNVNGFMPLSCLGRVQFTGIKWNIPGAIFFGGPNGSSGCYLVAACDFDFQGTGTWGQEGSSVQGTSFSLPGNIGCTIRNAFCGIGADVAPTASFGFAMCLQNTLVQINQGSTMPISAINTRNSNIQVALGSILSLVGANSNGTATTFSEFRGDQGFAPIQLSDQSTGNIDGTDFNGFTGYAIDAFTGSYLNVANFDFHVGGTGALGSAQGIAINGPGNTVIINGGGSATTVAGANGDVFVGCPESNMPDFIFGYNQLTGVSDTAAALSTTTVINLTTGGLTVNAYKGLTVNINGENRQVLSNAASTITVAVPFATAPAAGNVVTIQNGFLNTDGSSLTVTA